MSHDVIAFLAVCAAVICTPGQDTALTIRNTLRDGRRGGLQTALGVAGGQLLWAIAASTGLAALLAASDAAFAVLKLAGAAYLVLLGLQALRDAVRGGAAPSTAAAGRRSEPASRRSRAALRQGLLSNLGNPKMAPIARAPRSRPDLSSDRLRSARLWTLAQRGLRRALSRDVSPRARLCPLDGVARGRR